MTDPNKRNLLFFQSASMKGLYESMNEWQAKSRKRLLSTSIQKDGRRFCCIALTNPTEVIICNGNGGIQANVHSGCLEVRT